MSGIHYMPLYKAAAADAGVGLVMTSFNLINVANASTALEWLINVVLRNDWDLTVCCHRLRPATSQMLIMGVATKKNAAFVTLRAGTDMDMVTGRYLNGFKMCS